MSIPWSPVTSFIAGRDNAAETQRRNALLDMERQQQGQQNTLFQQGQEDRQAAQAGAASRAELMQRAQELAEVDASPPEYQEQWAAGVKQRNPQLAGMTAQDMLKRAKAGLYAQINGKLPEAQAPKRDIREVGGSLVEVGDTGVKSLYTAPQTPRPPGYGAPQAGINPATGKPDQFLVDDTGGLKWLGAPPVQSGGAAPTANAKAARDAQMKLPRLDAADRRAVRLSNAVQSLAKNRMADGGPVDQYLLRNTKQGQELVQAAASLLPEITALTRVPGIGSQSDLEQRLAALQLPSLEFAPEVNARAIEELQLFLKDLRQAYSNVASGQNAQGGQAPPAQSVLRFDANGRPIP